MSIPMTKTRLATLAAIEAHPNIGVTRLPDIVCPRPPLLVDGVPVPCHGWTAQGAARMSGRLTSALAAAGLISIRRTDFGVGTARITAAGASVLRGAA